MILLCIDIVFTLSQNTIKPSDHCLSSSIWTKMKKVETEVLYWLVLYDKLRWWIINFRVCCQIEVGQVIMIDIQILHRIDLENFLESSCRTVGEFLKNFWRTFWEPLEVFGEPFLSVSIRQSPSDQFCSQCVDPGLGSPLVNKSLSFLVEILINLIPCFTISSWHLNADGECQWDFQANVTDRGEPSIANTTSVHAVPKVEWDTELYKILLTNYHIHHSYKSTYLRIWIDRLLFLISTMRPVHPFFTPITYKLFKEGPILKAFFIYFFVHLTLFFLASLGNLIPSIQTHPSNKPHPLHKWTPFTIQYDPTITLRQKSSFQSPSLASTTPN